MLTLSRCELRPGAIVKKSREMSDPNEDSKPVFFFT